MKRGIIISDTHCGAIGGLTAPRYWQEQIKPMQEMFWNWYLRQINKYNARDFLICPADLTEGEGKKGQLGIILTNIKDQADCASIVLDATGVPHDKMYLVRGTPFHVNSVLEYEDLVASNLGASIEDVQRLEIEGWKIHTRHVVGRSDIPYGQATPLLRELTRVEHEALREGKDAPDIVIRGHVHYSVGVYRSGRMAITCPCLDLPIDSSNGRRYMAWYYDVGLGILELDKDVEPIYRPIILPVKLYHEGGYKNVF